MNRARFVSVKRQLQNTFEQLCYENFTTSFNAEKYKVKH